MKIKARLFLLAIAPAFAACSPTVKVQAPDKPIEINLNVNIEHRVKVEIEQDVKKAMKKNPNLF